MDVIKRDVVIVLLYLALLFSATTAMAAGSFGDIVERYADPTYITIGGGYDRKKNIHFEDIYFEAQLAVNLNWWNSDSNDICGEDPANCPPDEGLYRLYVPINFVVRQYASTSSPVKTPSYNPGLRLIYAHESWLNAADDFHFISLGIHHYSNGQTGDHLDPDSGEINTENGSFSTDYLEFAWFRVTDTDRLQLMKLKYRAYLTGLTWEPEQTDYYEDGLLEATAKFNLRGTWFDALQDCLMSCNRVDLFLTVGYKFGREFVTPGVAADTGDNLQYKLEYIAKPKSWKQMAFYARWDNGFDYYNINYRNRINRIQIGLVSRAF